MNHKHMLFAAIIFLLSSTSFARDYTRYESGEIWCNEQRWGDGVFDQQHLLVAKRGYIYALAASLALQKENDEASSHFFDLPSRMVEVDRPERKKSGFEVVTYELRALNNVDKVEELIIAFAGSNDGVDWRKTNFGFNRTQYTEARDYVTKFARDPKYADVRVIVAGYSLGGALAVHVTKNAATSNYITEAWAFNPSPRIYAKGNYDERIWQASSRGEALALMRKKFFRLLPNSANIGAPASHTASDYYLISSNRIYSHFRWVLTRNMLFAADIAMQQDSTNPYVNEPIEIIKKSRFSACKKESNLNIVDPEKRTVY